MMINHKHVNLPLATPTFVLALDAPRQHSLTQLHLMKACEEPGVSDDPQVVEKHQFLIHKNPNDEDEDDDDHVEVSGSNSNEKRKAIGVLSSSALHGRG